jgi:hypothetical protein
MKVCALLALLAFLLIAVGTAPATGDMIIIDDPVVTLPGELGTVT